MKKPLNILAVMCLLTVGSYCLGIGSGPEFLGGAGSGDARNKITFQIYNQLINYRRIIGENTLRDEEHYARYDRGN